MRASVPGVRYPLYVLIAALVIGLLTAYYFGIRPGTYAAVGSAAAFIVALVMPAWRLGVYGVVGVFVLGVVALGPRFGKPMGQSQLVRNGRRAVTWAVQRARKMRM